MWAVQTAQLLAVPASTSRPYQIVPHGACMGHAGAAPGHAWGMCAWIDGCVHVWAHVRTCRLRAVRRGSTSSGAPGAPPEGCTSSTRSITTRVRVPPADASGPCCTPSAAAPPLPAADGCCGALHTWPRPWSSPSAAGSGTSSAISSPALTYLQEGAHTAQRACMHRSARRELRHGSCCMLMVHAPCFARQRNSGTEAGRPHAFS